MSCTKYITNTDVAVMLAQFMFLKNEAKITSMYMFRAAAKQTETK